MRVGTPTCISALPPDGTVLEIRGTPCPAAVSRTSYSDVSATRKLSTPCRRPTKRWRAVSSARANSTKPVGGQRADAAKTRFLATASHDLVQPINAARLFVSSLDKRALPADVSALVTGGEFADVRKPDRRPARHLAADAQAQDVHLRILPRPMCCNRWPRSSMCWRANVGCVPRSADALGGAQRSKLLRRVLQIFSNVRYAARQVLIGCRHLAGAVRIEVWDTGPGIAATSRR